MSAPTRSIKESRVKKHVIRVFKEYSVHYFMPVQSGYGSNSLDFLGCHKGRFLAVETKAPGKHMTPRQELIRDEIEAAGGTVFVIGENFKPGDHVGVHGAPAGAVLKDTFSGMMELEGWLLLGP